MQDFAAADEKIDAFRVIEAAQMCTNHPETKHNSSYSCKSEAFLLITENA